MLRLFRNYAKVANGLASLNSVPIKKTRDIGIIAHIDAGKTTTTERMLFFSGQTKKIGNVDEGDTVTDYLQSERERGITIQLAAITIPWNNNKINIIDTPGHADFTFEVIRSLRVLDGAVTIFDSVEGVEAQTEKVWKQAQELHLPKISFINKMDRDGSNFNKTVKEIIEKLQTRVVICNLPYFEVVNNLPKFKGVVDVINKKVLVWDLEADANGNKVEILEPSDEINEIILNSRESMIETLGEFDDSIIDAFLENDENYLEIPSAIINESIRRNCIENNISPVFCGSAFKNIGIQPLMDAITNYLPSPTEINIPEITSTKRVKKKVHEKVQVPIKLDTNKGIVINNDDNLTVALAFKVITDPIRGVMTFFRVYSGKLTANKPFINTRTGEKYVLRNLLLMHGDEPLPVQLISSGNIGVIASNEDIVTGDTLVSHGALNKNFSDLEKNLKLLPIEIPPPLFNTSIQPLTAGDERYMNECIQSLLKEDPSLKVMYDEDLGQTILSGMGELHLEIVKDRLIRDMKAKITFNDIVVSYKETLTNPINKAIKLVDEDSNYSIEIEVDSFESDAKESSFASEDGSELLEYDNNVIILPLSASPADVIEDFNNKRWKSQFSIDEIYDNIVQGLTVGLSIGGKLYGLPLHSMAIRVKSWNAPIADKTFNPSRLLDLSRKVFIKAIESIPPDNFTILEPIMETKIYISSDKLGEVTHDLTSRCNATIISIQDETNENLELINWALQESSKIYLPPDTSLPVTSNTDSIKNKKVVVAHTPLREMIGYLNRLRSMTKGRSTFDMEYLGMQRANHSRLSIISKGF